MQPFAYVRAGDAAGTRSPGRARDRRQPRSSPAAPPARPDEGRRRAATAQLVDINGLPLHRDRGRAATAAAHRRAGAQRATSPTHPAVRAHYPVLAEALLAGASPQLRNMATIGGNLLQRTRCTYFRDTGVPCNKREPGHAAARRSTASTACTRSSAPATHCIATHPSDMAVALVALDAVVDVQGADGERRVPIAEFLPAAGRHAAARDRAASRAS